MTPKEVIYGDRNSDDSGWERQVSMDAIARRVWVEFNSERICMDFDEMEWLIRALLAGRDALGMDKLRVQAGACCEEGS